MKIGNAFNSNAADIKNTLIANAINNINVFVLANTDDGLVTITNTVLNTQIKLTTDNRVHNINTLLKQFNLSLSDFNNLRDGMTFDEFNRAIVNTKDVMGDFANKISLLRMFLNNVDICVRLNRENALLEEFDDVEETYDDPLHRIKSSTVHTDYAGSTGVYATTYDSRNNIGGEDYRDFMFMRSRGPMNDTLLHDEVIPEEEDHNDEEEEEEEEKNEEELAVRPQVVDEPVVEEKGTDDEPVEEKGTDDEPVVEEKGTDDEEVKVDDDIDVEENKEEEEHHEEPVKVEDENSAQPSDDEKNTKLGSSDDEHVSERDVVLDNANEEESISEEPEQPDQDASQSIIFYRNPYVYIASDDGSQDSSEEVEDIRRHVGSSYKALNQFKQNQVVTPVDDSDESI